MSHKNIFRIAVPLCATVRQLKELIEEHDEVLVKQQRLFKDELFEDCCLPIARTIELDDDRLCSSYDYRRYGLIFLYGDITEKLYIRDALRELTFSIKFTDDMRINEVKHKIQKHTEIPVNVQVLRKAEPVSGGLFPKYRPITLEDDQPCSFYKFRRYEQVTLMRVNASVSDVHRSCQDK